MECKRDKYIQQLNLSQWITHEEASNYNSLKNVTQIVIAMQINMKIMAELLFTPEFLRERRLDISTNSKGIRDTASSLFIESLIEIDCIYAIVSSECKNPIFVSEEGIYVVYLVPIETTTTDSTVQPIGTIFTIYRRPPVEGKSINKMKQVLCTGVDMRVSCAAVYGRLTVLVIAALSRKVAEFHLDPMFDEFMLVVRDIQMPNEGHVYYTDEKQATYWNKATCSIIHSRKYTLDGKYSSNRFLGSVAAMVYRVLKNGGLLVLANCSQNKSDGLRLLFEINPFTHLIRAGGGFATIGAESSLQIKPTNILEVYPFFAGSRQEMNHVMRVFKFEKAYH